MDRIKKFLAEKGVNKNFKKAGIGYRLNDSSKPAVTEARSEFVRQQTPQAEVAERIAAADVAAQAALKRINFGVKDQESLTRRNIRMRAIKELEKEKKEREGHMENKKDVEVARQEIDKRADSSAISGVFFTCDLLGNNQQFTRNEMRQRLEEFLRTQLADDPLVASALMISSLNGSDRKEIASQTLQKYLTNLIESPHENKYHRIRTNNKIFQERVAVIKGGKEFLLACGFEEKYIINDEQPELYLEIPNEKAADTQSLIQALELLQSGQDVPIKLSRNVVVYRLDSNQAITNPPQLPPDFFDLKIAEIKKEQQQREADVRKLTTLRTREMREHDEQSQNHHYKYTLLRIKFPNRFLLQGTFGCYELFSAVRLFVQEHLVTIQPQLFILKDPISGRAISGDTKTLTELNLVPAAVLHFEWDPELQADLVQLGQEVSYLDQRFIENAEQFPCGSKDFPS